MEDKTGEVNVLCEIDSIIEELRFDHEVATLLNLVSMKHEPLKGVSSFFKRRTMTHIAKMNSIRSRLGALMNSQ